MEFDGNLNMSIVDPWLVSTELNWYNDEWFSTIIVSDLYSLSLLQLFSQNGD